MIRAGLVLATVLALSGSAHADIWRHAIEQGSPDIQADIFESEMKSGDELTLQATSTAVSTENVRQLVSHAALSYHNAATALPASAEPHYRIGRLIYSFYFECSESPIYSVRPSPLCPRDLKFFDQKRAQEVIDAWDAFEARAPLDPRLGVVRDDGTGIDFNLLFHRAVLHTRFATKEHLAAAVRDYEKILARTDLPDDTVLSNLAETYMMLGRIDEAIETYRQALRTNRNTETMYGLAVALDRDERGAQAFDVIVAQGEQAMAEFHKRVTTGTTFFVPRGEEFYYFALAYEAFGMTDSAIEYWKQFLTSDAAKAHAEYKARAKEHLDPLLHDHNRKALHLEAPWRDFLRR